MDGRYVLHVRLGSGSTSEVWRATHEALTREYAIKFLRAETLKSAGSEADEMADRFRFEAQVCCVFGANVGHIVAVHDAGVFRGRPYMVMDLVRGSSVASALKAGELDIDATSKMLGQVAEALDTCHALGLAHRDTKPANILLDGAGNYRVADFGLAKFFGAAPAGLLKPRETTAETLIGTPSYMSPEAISGEPTRDGRADVWALAVTAYECLTQRLPFEGEAWPGVAVAIMKRKFQPPSAHRSDLARYDSLFDKAFAQEIGARFQAPREFVRAFEEARGSLVEAVPVNDLVASVPVARGSSTPELLDPQVGDEVRAARSPLRASRRGWGVGLVLLSIGFAVALSGLVAVGKDGPRQVVNASAAVPKLRLRAARPLALPVESSGRVAATAAAPPPHAPPSPRTSATVPSKRPVDPSEIW